MRSSNFILREAIAISVVPSIKAEIPTPEPPPVTVILAALFLFMKFSASVWVRGKQVSLPFIFWANTFVANKHAAMAANKIVFFITLYLSFIYDTK